MKVDLLSLSADETDQWAVRQGFEPYRGRQIRHWLLQRLATSFDDMTDLPKSIRAVLKQKAIIRQLETVKILVSKDGTKKYLFKLADDNLIESVLIPERDHYTLCISTQSGCAMGCRFCLTARGGFKRDLTPAEIIEQVMYVKRSADADIRLTNIVLMGMGEPLANYKAVVKSVRNLVGEDGMNFSHRKVTLSTCGIVPKIRRMAGDIKINLAVSLNAANDATRSFLMPINNKYPLKSLLSACRDFPLPNRRMITFEYILIKGINDHVKDAQDLVGLLSGIRAKINLIPLNSFPPLKMSPPLMEDILIFQETLVKNHFTAMIRKSKGSDILAACGQLSGAYAHHFPLP